MILQDDFAVGHLFPGPDGGEDPVAAVGPGKERLCRCTEELAMAPAEHRHQCGVRLDDAVLVIEKDKTVVHRGDDGLRRGLRGDHKASAQT